jgi:hypothetical protein
MMEQTLTLVGKLTAGCVATATGLFMAATEFPDNGWIQGLERLGSFLVLSFFIVSLVLIARAALPRLFDFLESTRTGFLNELAKEREARERGMDGFREMLQAHKHDLVEASKKQTDAIDNLVRELKK